VLDEPAVLHLLDDREGELHGLARCWDPLELPALRAGEESAEEDVVADASTRVHS
jgi:hypothetical protein